MTDTDQARHVAQRGKRQGQWVVCHAEVACTIGNHISEEVFRAAQLWLREVRGQRKTTTAITDQDVTDFQGLQDSLTWLDRYRAQQAGDRQRVYTQLLAHIFQQHHTAGATEVSFDRSEILHAARELNLAIPKNLGDVIYAFRYRTDLPASIESTAAPGMAWLLLGGGRGRYMFVQKPRVDFTVDASIPVQRVTDKTPGLVARHALSSEQALLVKVRYNNLVDTVTGLTCNSLQNHLRAYVPNWGQVETDEVYVGQDATGAEYAVMVEAKGGSDRLSMVQLWQDQALARAKFPGVKVKVVAIQFVNDRESAFFVFDEAADGSLELTDRQRFLLV